MEKIVERRKTPKRTHHEKEVQKKSVTQEGDDPNDGGEVGAKVGVKGKKWRLRREENTPSRTGRNSRKKGYRDMRLKGQ